MGTQSTEGDTEARIQQLETTVAELQKRVAKAEHIAGVTMALAFAHIFLFILYMVTVR